MIPMIEPQASAKQHERSDRGDKQLRDLLQAWHALPGDCVYRSSTATA
jgi:hypothetical protein